MPPELGSLLSGQVLFFLLFGFLAIVAAITMVLFPNPVRSALFLVLNMFCIAGLYLLLGAYFLATVQVVVYAGAIMVLFLFVIMLLNLGTPDRQVDKLRWQQPVAVAAGLLLAAVFGWTVASSVPAVPLNAVPTSVAASRFTADNGPVTLDGTTAPDPASATTVPGQPTRVDAENMGTVEGIGRTLYDPAQPWLFPFEVTSILLLIAVIGSVVLAKRRDVDVATPGGFD